jgi:hypothetical protein
LPERDLAEVILDVAKPLLGKLGSTPTMEDTHNAIALAVTFWNANVLASKRWDHPLWFANCSSATPGFRR